MRRPLLPIVSLVAASACGGPVAPSTAPATTGASSSSVTAASSTPPSASASAPTAPKVAPGWLVNGKPAHEADAFDVEAAVKKAGWKTEGFLYGGTIGVLEQYGVAATLGAKKARIGFTRKASKPNEAPAFAAKYDRKTLYKLAAATKEAPVLKSIDDEAHEVFCWITDDKGTTAEDAKALFDAVFVPGK